MSATLLAAACLVDRASTTFECNTTDDCSEHTGRVCKGGFCVVPNCPGDCPDCDEEAKICNPNCSNTNDCDTVRCPTGWTCAITCLGANACSTITCETGSKCTVTCSGTDACETVDCDAACKCDLTCDVAGACNTPECPTTGNGANEMQCTADGTNTGLCSSTRAAGCTKC